MSIPVINLIPFENIDKFKNYDSTIESNCAQLVIDNEQYRSATNMGFY